MKAVKEALIERNYKVEMLDELLRTEVDDKFKSIDQIRKNPVEYFELQKRIITKKIEQEKFAFSNKDTNTVFLVDRAISDSLFYLENYVDKTNLPDCIIDSYCKFHEQVRKYAHEAFKNYSVIAEFMPLNNANDAGVFRPKSINILKQYEYSVIHMLNRFYAYTNRPFNNTRYYTYDLNEMSINKVTEHIINALHLQRYENY